MGGESSLSLSLSKHDKQSGTTTGGTAFRFLSGFMARYISPLTCERFVLLKFLLICGVRQIDNNKLLIAGWDSRRQDKI